MAEVAPSIERAKVGAALAENDERQDYLRATLKPSPEASGGLIATPFQKQDSSMVGLLARADCLIVRAPKAPPLPAGSAVPIHRLDAL